MGRGGWRCRFLRRFCSELRDIFRAPALYDSRIGQRLLQCGDAGIGDFRFKYVKRFEIGELFELRQTGVGDLRAVEIEVGDVLKTFKMREHGIGRRRFFEMQHA